MRICLYIIPLCMLLGAVSSYYVRAPIRIPASSLRSSSRSIYRTVRQNRYPSYRPFGHLGSLPMTYLFGRRRPNIFGNNNNNNNDFNNERVGIRNPVRTRVRTTGRRVIPTRIRTLGRTSGLRRARPIISRLPIRRTPIVPRSRGIRLSPRRISLRRFTGRRTTNVRRPVRRLVHRPQNQVLALLALDDVSGGHRISGQSKVKAGTDISFNDGRIDLPVSSEMVAKSTIRKRVSAKSKITPPLTKPQKVPILPAKELLKGSVLETKSKISGAELIGQDMIAPVEGFKQVVKAKTTKTEALKKDVVAVATETDALSSKKTDVSAKAKIKISDADTVNIKVNTPSAAVGEITKTSKVVEPKITKDISIIDATLKKTATKETKQIVTKTTGQKVGVVKPIVDHKIATKITGKKVGVIKSVVDQKIVTKTTKKKVGIIKPVVHHKMALSPVVKGKTVSSVAKGVVAQSAELTSLTKDAIAVVPAADISSTKKTDVAVKSDIKIKDVDTVNIKADTIASLGEAVKVGEPAIMSETSSNNNNININASA